MQTVAIISAMTLICIILWLFGQSSFGLTSRKFGGRISDYEEYITGSQSDSGIGGKDLYTHSDSRTCPIYHSPFHFMCRLIYLPFMSMGKRRHMESQATDVKSASIMDSSCSAYAPYPLQTDNRFDKQNTFCKIREKRNISGRGKLEKEREQGLEKAGRHWMSSGKVYKIKQKTSKWFSFDVLTRIPTLLYTAHADIPVSIYILSSDEMEKFIQDKPYKAYHGIENNRIFSYELNLPNRGDWYIVVMNHNKKQATVELHVYK